LIFYDIWFVRWFSYFTGDYLILDAYMIPKSAAFKPILMCFVTPKTLNMPRGIPGLSQYCGEGVPLEKSTAAYPTCKHLGSMFYHSQSFNRNF
jgi:hypothetical protein